MGVNKESTGATSTALSDTAYSGALAMFVLTTWRKANQNTLFYIIIIHYNILLSSLASRSSSSSSSNVLIG